MSTEERLDGAGGIEKDVLRVALDQDAIRAYNEMASRLKALGSHVKFYPSQFVSHIVSDFFETYFERDLESLVSKFFDAKAFIAAEVQRAQSADEAVEILRNLSGTIEKIKGQGRASRRSKERSGGVPRGRPKSKNTEEKQGI